MIGILIVDDHRLVRVGTATVLNDVEGFEVIGQSGSGERAIELVRELEPDLVLMDINMPGIGGLEAIRRCLRAAPDVKIIAVSMFAEEPYPSRVLGIGAHGYLTKRSDVDEMIIAIRKVMAGQRYIAAEIAQQLALRPFTEDDKTPFEELSGREMQIALMVVNGHKVSQISNSLSLSPKTVNSYRYRIFDKLGVKSDVDLTRLAIKHRVIDAALSAS